MVLCDMISASSSIAVSSSFSEKSKLAFQKILVTRMYILSSSVVT